MTLILNMIKLGNDRSSGMLPVRRILVWKSKSRIEIQLMTDRNGKGSSDENDTVVSSEY
jgi:hypothetical protein